MIWSQTANLLTAIRAGIALGLPWLGFLGGAGTLPLATALMLTCWITDFFDGTTARRNPEHHPSLLGKHDLQVDMSASGGALLYMLGAGYVSNTAVVIYVVVWGLIFWRYGVSKPTGSLAQAPIYGWFLWVSSQRAPMAFQWVVAWLALVLLFTWRKFAFGVIPEFLSGMGDVLRRE